MKKNINNSKYKNTGVLFELLVHRITSETINGLNESPALNIMRKFFKPSTELGKELQLYRAFFEHGKQLTEAKSIHYIDLLGKHRVKLNERKLAVEKYELVKEVKNHYDLREFLRGRVDNYRIYASIYKTFAVESAKAEMDIANIQDVAMARFALIEHLSSSQKKPSIPDAVLTELKKQDEAVRLLTNRIIIEKFNEKYADLNQNQKALLREYISNVSNPVALAEYVKKTLPDLKSGLRTAAKKLDKVKQIKVNEVVNQLDKFTSKTLIKENEVTAMMIAYEILNEIS